MVYVISGGPGFGKTVLIEKLHELGYQVGGEIARQIMVQQIAEFFRDKPEDFLLYSC